MVDKGTKVLITNRFILRQWKESDANEAFSHWMNDSNVTKYLTWLPHENVSITRKLLKTWEEECKKPDCYHWALVLKTENILVGDIGIMQINKYQERGEISYCMGKNWWGKGLMTEALSAVLRYCFEEVGFFRLNGCCVANNIGSARVMKKCGLVYEGTRRKHTRLLSTGEWVDIVEYGILREDYFKSKLKVK